jgi:hypothetical protein
MKKLKFTNYIFWSISGLLLLCCNNNTKQADNIKEEIVEFVSFKKIDFSNLDTNYVFYTEPEEIDCVVTIIWKKSKNQFHIYDDGKGIINYEVIENSENDNEVYLEAKEKMRNKDVSDEEKATVEPFINYLKMKIEKKDSVALLEIGNKYYGTVYFMQ